MASNRTWETRPYGIIGGPSLAKLGKRRQGGNVNPPCNRKSRSGNPPPTAIAPYFYQRHARFDAAGFGNRVYGPASESIPRGNSEPQVEPKDTALDLDPTFRGGEWKRRHHAKPGPRHCLTRLGVEKLYCSTFGQKTTLQDDAL